VCITTPPPTGGAQKMSDEGEEVRYSDRDPARTRRGSDDLAGKTSTNSTEREREREIQKSSSFFISFFFLPSKSWLEKVPFWPSSQRLLSQKIIRTFCWPFFFIN